MDDKLVRRLTELSQVGISKYQAAATLVSEGFFIKINAAYTVIKRATGAAGKRNYKYMKLNWKKAKKEFKPSKPSKKGYRILLMDIETAFAEAAVWSTGKQFVGHHQILKEWYVICWAAKWLNDTEVFGSCVTPEEAMRRDDKRVLTNAWQVMNEADIIIWHNGDYFDGRKLNARFLFHDMLPPSPYQTIDTLKQSKRNFALMSNSQDYITKLLQLPQKRKTEFILWVKCAQGERDSLKYMFEYCTGDIHGLEEVYLTLRPWIKSHPNVAMYESGEELLCSYCGSEALQLKGSYKTPVNSYNAFRCKDCGGFTRSRLSSLTVRDKRKLGRSVAR